MLTASAILIGFLIYLLPIETVHFICLPFFILNLVSLILILIFSSNETNSSYLILGTPRITNSSPPHLPTIILLLEKDSNISAIPDKTLSPDACPYVSFTFLKKSISIIATE